MDRPKSSTGLAARDRRLNYFPDWYTLRLHVRQVLGKIKDALVVYFWMAYQGMFQSLPQVVVGAMNPLNDVGMAMKNLQLDRTDEMAAALCAFGAMAAAGLWLGWHLLSLASAPAQVDSRNKRTGFILRTASLRGLAGIPLIILFRLPRNFLELVVWPLIVTVAGTCWLPLSAARRSRAILRCAETEFTSVVVRCCDNSAADFSAGLATGSLHLIAPLN